MLHVLQSLNGPKPSAASFQLLPCQMPVEPIQVCDIVDELNFSLQVGLDSNERFCKRSDPVPLQILAVAHCEPIFF